MADWAARALGPAIHETQQLACEGFRRWILSRQPSLPAGPAFWNRASFWCGQIDPTLRLFCAQKHVTGTEGLWPRELEFIQTRGQGFREGLARVEAEDPLGTGELQVVSGRNAREGLHYLRAIFTGDAQGFVARLVVDDQNFIAGMQRFQRPPKLQSGVGSVQQCGDDRHGRSRRKFTRSQQRFALRKRGDAVPPDSVTPKSFSCLELAHGISDFVTRKSFSLTLVNFC